MSMAVVSNQAGTPFSLSLEQAPGSAVQLRCSRGEQECCWRAGVLVVGSRAENVVSKKAHSTGAAVKPAICGDDPE